MELKELLKHEEMARRDKVFCPSSWVIVQKCDDVSQDIDIHVAYLTGYAEPLWGGTLHWMPGRAWLVKRRGDRAIKVRQ